jgi:hypothetical protein
MINPMSSPTGGAPEMLNRVVLSQHLVILTQAHTLRDGRVQVCNCCDLVTASGRRSVASSGILVEEIDPGRDTL